MFHCQVATPPGDYSLVVEERDFHPTRLLWHHFIIYFILDTLRSHE